MCEKAKVSYEKEPYPILICDNEKLFSECHLDLRIHSYSMKIEDISRN